MTAGCLATVMQSTAKYGKLSKIWSETPANGYPVLTAVNLLQVTGSTKGRISVAFSAN